VEGVVRGRAYGEGDGVAATERLDVLMVLRRNSLVVTRGFGVVRGKHRNLFSLHARARLEDGDVVVDFPAELAAEGARAAAAAVDVPRLSPQVGKQLPGVLNCFFDGNLAEDVASELVGELAALLGGHHALVQGQVGLVADQGAHRTAALVGFHVGVRVRSDELQSGQLVEAVLVCDVINKNESLSPFALVFEHQRGSILA